MAKEYMDLNINGQKVEIITLEEVDIREARGHIYAHEITLGGYVIYEHKKTGLSLLLAKLFKKPTFDGYIAIPEMTEEEYSDYLEVRSEKESQEKERLEEARIKRQAENDEEDERLQEERDWDFVMMTLADEDDPDLY